MSSQAELRQTITNTIIDVLKSGVLPPWKKPWANDPNAPGLHTSLSTGDSYRGINQILLAVAAMKHGFKSRWWGTFNQIRFNDGSVRRGERATKIVLWKPIQRTRTNENGEEKAENLLIMREFAVFNADQATGLDRFQVGFSKAHIDLDGRYETAERTIQATGADIRLGGNQAFYSLHGDFVQLPFRTQFGSPEAYFETAFHELSHWSESRIGFQRTDSENSYAFGELVAEISACFVMGELGLPTSENLANHVSYISNWLQAMNNDPRFIFKAAAQAAKSTDFILSFSRSEMNRPEALIV